MSLYKTSSVGLQTTSFDCVAQNGWALNSTSMMYNPVRESQLINHDDGSLEVTPKTIAEVAGERIVRPLLDTVCDFSKRSFQMLQSSFSLFDQMARKINFLPVAAAQQLPDQTALQKCLDKSLDEAVGVVRTGAANAEPELINTPNAMFHPLFKQCFEDHNYQKTFITYNANVLKHEQEKEKYDKKLSECEKKHGAEVCYPYLVEKSPEIFKVEVTHSIDGQIFTAKEWRANEGFLSWSIYVDNWLRRDTLFASGSYNYDNGKSIVTQDKM